MTAEKAVDKCEGLRVEHAFSHRPQCLKTKAKSILIINHEHLCDKGWRRGWGCPFSPLCVSLRSFACSLENRLLVLLHLLTGTELVGWVLYDMCGLHKSGCRWYPFGQTPSSKAFSGFTHLNYCCIFNQLLLTCVESHIAPLCVVYLTLRADNKTMQLLIYQQTPTAHFLTCE